MLCLNCNQLLYVYRMVQTLEKAQSSGIWQSVPIAIFKKSIFKIEKKKKQQQQQQQQRKFRPRIIRGVSIRPS